MNNKSKNSIVTISFAVVLTVSALYCWFKPETAFSETERRTLAEKPRLSSESVFSGDFMRNIEKYTVDQFPLRDNFRALKAFFSTGILAKKDNNGLFSADGHISKIEYPQNDKMLQNAAEKFDYIYNEYLKSNRSNIFLSIVPDKNCFLAKNHGYLSLDYEKFVNDFTQMVPYMQYIDIFPLLSINDYYRTDSHWRQENISDVAQHLILSMGSHLNAEYSQIFVSDKFYGVYAGQSALAVKPDTLSYLTNDTLKNFTVKYWDTGRPVVGEMYNTDKATGKDPYEMFLSGTSPIVTIENNSATVDKELIIFRDSFGSSIAPLLAQGYKKTTVIDIRYVQSAFLKNFVDFSGQDTLFLYSTTLLNNSTALR